MKILTSLLLLLKDRPLWGDTNKANHRSYRGTIHPADQVHKTGLNQNNEDYLCNHIDDTEFSGTITGRHDQLYLLSEIHRSSPSTRTTQTDVLFTCPPILPLIGVFEYPLNSPMIFDIGGR